MAYRRRQQQQQWSEDGAWENACTREQQSAASSLAAKAMRASSAHLPSSLSSAYTSSPSPPPRPPPPSQSQSPAIPIDAAPLATPRSRDQPPKHGFWGSLARKAKSILDEPPSPDTATSHQLPTPSPPLHACNKAPETTPPPLQKGIDAIASSLHYIGNAVEEGINIVENRAANIIQETRKHVRRKPTRSEEQNHKLNQQKPLQESHTQQQMEAEQEIQLKASRDVAMAMAAKAKLLLRELKTVKADLAFAKERCAQLEEENKMLRVNNGRGDNPDDDDLVRLQLETLLAEKARLAHENSVYARENRFLREIVEYHQLTMQDVIYLDENTEEVNEVYPLKIPLVSKLHMGATSVPTTSHPAISSRDPHSTNSEMKINEASRSSPLPESMEAV